MTDPHALLTAYEAWRSETIHAGVDASPGAYLAELRSIRALEKVTLLWEMLEEPFDATIKSVEQGQALVDQIKEVLAK